MLTTLIAGVIDALQRRIPNPITFGLLGAGVAFHLAAPMGQGWSHSLIGGATGLLLLLPLYVRGGAGAGDVKLLAGIGCWLGFHDVLAIFVVSATLLGIMSLVIQLRRREGKSIPMAPVLAAAMFVLCLWPMAFGSPSQPPDPRSLTFLGSSQ
jgi:prepilin peptidase CpaA